MRRSARALQEAMVAEVTAALRHATPEQLEAGLKALKNGHNGTKKKKKQSRFHGADHYLSPAEFTALIRECSPFYSLLFRVMLAFALRVSEALSLRPDNLSGNFLVVQRLKNGLRTRQLVPPDLLAELKQRVATGSYRLFACHRSSAYLAFRRAAEKVGIDRDRCHPHCVRHSAVMMMLNAGTPIHIVSRFVGHRSLSSTSAYCNVSDSTASAAATKVFASLFDHSGEPMPSDAQAVSDVAFGTSKVV